MPNHSLLLKLFFLFLLSFFVISTSEGQQKIVFPSSDGLPITADVYGKDKSLPYILLFHQANYSRGEYRETAHKFQKLGYNCIAVDLRSGKEVNFIQNETAAAARLKNLPTDYFDAEKDIVASIEYVKKISKERIILLGSSYSASLVLKVAKNNRSINAVIAFSPGEYFPNLKFQDAIAKLDKPIFIASTANENSSVKQLASGINAAYITWYVPSKTQGMHGSRALWASTPGSNDCWMQLLLFFKKLKR